MNKYSSILAARALSQASLKPSLKSSSSITVLRAFSVTGISDEGEHLEEDEPFGLVINPADEYSAETFMSFRRTKGQAALLRWLSTSDTSFGTVYSFGSMSICNPYDYFETVAFVRYLQTQGVFCVVE